MLALVAVLPPLLCATASPIAKRYTGVKIVSGRDGKCLAAAPKTSVGSAVTSVDCNSNPSYPMLWDINPGSGSVVLSGTDLALDAGSSPGNNGGLKVWTSYPGLYQQTWYLTGDNRIAITGGDQCLDEGDNGIQTYQCTTGNTNQVFNVGGSTTTSSGPSSTSAPSSSSTSASASATPSAGGQTIVWDGNDKLCLTVQGGYAALGTEVALSSCFGGAEPYSTPVQHWIVPAVGTTGQIKLAGTDYCLDAGTSPHDSVDMKIWTCYDGLEQQQWAYTGTRYGNTLVTANNECLDVVQDSIAGTQKPYNSLKNVQTYTCYVANNNQLFHTA